jgi:prepilin-type N-terminal cleavage/methylation domain-containing protein
MIAQFYMPPKKNDKPRSGQRNSAGFTLLELLIGMAVFAIGTLAIAGLQTHSTNTNTAARRQLEVEAHVGRFVELYKNLPWTEKNSPAGASPAVIDDADIDGDGSLDALPLVDTDGDGMGGINDTGIAADYVFDAGSTGVYSPIRPNDGLQVFVNLARDATITNSLTINIIAQWNQLGRPRTYSVLFLKGRNI